MDKLLIETFKKVSKKPFTLHIHNKVNNEKIVSFLTIRRAQKIDELNGCKEARIVDYDDDTCMYMIGKDVYLIPARVRGIVNNNDGKLNFVFEYPCEMKVEDLISY